MTQVEVNILRKKNNLFIITANKIFSFILSGSNLNKKNYQLSFC